MSQLLLEITPKINFESVGSDKGRKLKISSLTHKIYLELASLKFSFIKVHYSFLDKILQILCDLSPIRRYNKG